MASIPFHMFYPSKSKSSAPKPDEQSRRNNILANIAQAAITEKGAISGETVKEKDDQSLQEDACAEPIRFRNREYIGLAVNLEMARNELGQVSYSFGNKPPTTSVKQRKNRNPLLTRFTVKNLKKLLEQQDTLFDSSSGVVIVSGVAPFRYAGQTNRNDRRRSSLR